MTRNATGMIRIDEACFDQIWKKNCEIEDNRDITHPNMKLKYKFCTAEQETFLYKRVNRPRNSSNRVKLQADS